MRFVIIGAGDVGANLCVKLASHQHDVILIEKRLENISKQISSLDLQIIIGNGSCPEVLSRAGIEAADYVIAVTDSDEVNVAACFISRLINPEPKRIARLRDLEIAHRSINPELLSEYFDLIINPDQAGAEYLLRLFKVPGAREIVEFAGGKLRMLGLSVGEDSAIVNVKLNSLKDWNYELPLLILAVLRGTKLIIPKGDDKVKPGDIIYAVTTPEKTKLLFEIVGKQLHEGKSATIWGGTHMARSLAHALEAQGTAVKIIMSDAEQAVAMAGEYKKSLVLHGDGTDQNLLMEENVGNSDAFIAAAPDEEGNVLAALLAKKLGVKTSMALINQASYVPLVSTIGVDVVISSRLAAASAIFRHIHSQALLSEFALQNEGAGFIEIDITKNLPISGLAVKDLKLPHGILVSAIARDEDVIIPGGDDILMEGDRVVIFVIKSAMKKLEKLLDIKLELFA